MESDPISFEIGLILLLIIANGIFAMSELAIVSSRKVRLETKAEEGSRGAKVALELAKEPTNLLSAVQVGITLIGIFTGAFGGSTIAKPLSAYLKNIPVLAAHSDAISLALVVSIITYFSLIIGELVPKKVALNNPERIASTVAIPMQLFSRITSPFVKALSASTNLVLKIFNIKESDEPPVTEEEVRIMIAQGAIYGTFEEAEKEMVDRIFRLGDMRVGGLMTPRTRVEWLDLEDTDENNLKVLTESRYSYFPVGRGSLDDIVGVVHTKDLLAQRVSCTALQLEKAVREPLFVPKSMRAFKVLEMFKQYGTHFALVMDEYGNFSGLVTLNDIMEQIVGDIPLADENNDPDIVQRDANSWLLDGMLSIGEVKALYDLDELPGEDKEHFQTLGGFVVSYLGHIPTVSENFTWNGLRFEVVDMDRIRVDKVLVTKLIDNSKEDYVI